MAVTEAYILDQLKQVAYPGFSKDIVAFGFVKSIEITDQATKVHIEITSSAPEVSKDLDASIRKVLANVSNLDLQVQAPREKRETSSRDKNIAPSIKSFAMVSSGKGGVGKTTTSVNIAIALAMQGKKVGLLDADIYGPNVPRMMGFENEKPIITSDNKLEPFEAYGVKMVSMGNLMGDGKSVIWRGAMIMKAITQLLQDVKWGDLDVLVIDMPPGTGDAQLTLAQSVPITAGINVTTPQVVSLDDSARSLDMFEKLHIPIAGIIENMSGFVCPSCDTHSPIFDSGTSEGIAKRFQAKVLAKVPLEPAIREGGDTGKPIVYNHPQSQSAKLYMQCADALWEKIQDILKQDAASNASIQPTMTVPTHGKPKGNTSFSTKV